MQNLSPPAGCTALVPLQGPVDVGASLGWVSRWGDDLLDRWDGVTVVRSARRRGRTIVYAVAPGGTLQRPVLTVTVESPGQLGEAITAAAATVDSDAPALAALRRRDPLIAALDDLYPGLRPVRTPDLLTSIVRAISAQQVNLRWACETRRRLAESFGTPHVVGGREVRSLDAERLAGVPVTAIRALQFTTRKAEYIVGAAQAIASGGLDLEELQAMDDEAVIERLEALRGIGRWTAEWLLDRTLGRPRVVAGDLGVRKVVGAAYLDGAMPSEAEVRAATAHWGAGAIVAQQLLLHHAYVAGGGLDTLTELARQMGATEAAR